MVRNARPQHNVPINERNGNNRRRLYGKLGSGSVKEIARGTDPVRLSFLTALLSDGGVTAILFDTHASIVQGSLGVLPQRLMVADDEYDRAVGILKSAGEWHEPEESGWL
jgi:Putative prokaryotic signal transducing protein